MAPPPPAFFVTPSPVLSKAAEPSVKATPTAPTPTAEASPKASPAAQTADDKVLVSLRSLVAVMPDHVFACPRTELWRRIDLDSRVPLPRDVILPQLQMARVRIPLSVAVAAMPASILATPLPSIGNETVPLALQEIVPQLPPGLFATAATQSEEETLDFSESDIPMPFIEKIFAAEGPEVEAAEPAETVAAEPSQPKPAVEPNVFEVSTEVFADEGLSIFAEKTATPESAAAEVESQPAPTPEVVAAAPAPAVEAEPEMQPPDADTKPVEAATPAETVADVSAEGVSQTESVPVPSELVSPVPTTAHTPWPIEPPPAPPESATEPPAETVADVSAEGVSQTESVPVPSEVVSPVPTTVHTPWPIEPPPVPPESATEPAAAPTPVAQSPAAPEIVHEVAAPVEQPSTAPAAAPTENKFLLNLNQCTAEDLANVEGVGPVLAQRIIEFRNAQGGFKSPKELRHVPGINRKTLRTLTGPAPRTLNRLLNVEHNEELTLQEIVRLTSQLKGVSGCILAMSDGVFLTGQLPPHLDQETISVFAPQLFKKVGRYMKELRVGQITRLSVFTDQQPLSIFHAGDIFLVVIHDSRYFSKALLRRCERISQEIARLCRQRAVV